MFLKYLDVQGFKSFPDKTRVTFGRGLTGVVGPNGSGKSNISDAVRWVLGEQSTKTLRGDKMEDVIFTGTRSRKPQSFAEVSLTLDNTGRELNIDSDEVTLTRRYDRSGESEYRINQSPVRLRDITELLMDTGLGRDGYSLIGQGKIAEIINAKSTDRREIFEEAAGIAKFRYRKNEAERNLIRAEENLVRLRDILAELEGRVEPLREQSQKAKQYLELAAQKKGLEISLWVDTTEKANQELKDQSDRLLAGENRRQEAQEAMEKLESRIQAAFDQMQLCLMENEKLRRRKSELEEEIGTANARIAVCENDILHNRQNMERISGEIANQDKLAGDTEEKIAARRQKIGELTAQAEELQTRFQELQEKLLVHVTESENLSSREKELSDALNESLLGQSQANMAMLSAKESLEELRHTLSDNLAQKQQAEGQRAAYQKESEEASRFYGELCEKAEGLQNALRGQTLKLENRKQKLLQIQQEYDKINLSLREKEQRIKLLEGLETAMEGYAFSVKEVLKRAKKGILPGIRGTVSQLLNVREEYATAIETAIGGSLQHIVVEEEASAKAAIRLLKEENLGRATFLPLTSVSGKRLQTDGMERYAGFIDLAVNLVDFDPAYLPVMDSLLGRIAVVDDIDTAVLMARKFGYTFRIVTLDGQLVNAGGSLTGGSKQKSAGFLSRKNEIASLQKECRALSARLAKGKEVREQAQAEAARMEAECTAVSAEITTVNEDKIRVEGEQKRLAQLLSQNEQILSAMEREWEQKNSRLEELAQTVEAKQQESAQLEKQLQQLTGELEQLQAVSRDSAGEREELSRQCNEIQLSKIALQKDIEMEKQAVAELAANRSSASDIRERLEQEKAACLASIEGIRQEIAQKQAYIEESRAQAEGLENAAGEALQKRQELEGETTRLRREERAAQEEKEKIASELARMEEKKHQIQLEYDGLIRKLWDEYELTRSEAQKLASPIEESRKANLELNTLRNKIRSLGSINVDAIEEYRQVRERYEFLSGQIADAERSKGELLRLIGELTDKMKTIFSENFEKINRHFQTIFAELFGGGRAELRLTSPAELLESGVEIAVEPPGKVINNLASLSGGEQSLVAIAIYFAILKVHPAPFCILDEIEAALDDVNVDKYAAYLHTLCDSTQFIAITHRRGTMEAADVLYGVTMQEEGVSKLLELKVSEMEEKLNMERVGAR